MDKLNQSLALSKLISQFENKQSITGNGTKNLLYILSSIAIGVNVQVYTTSVQDLLHKD